MPEEKVSTKPSLCSLCKWMSRAKVAECQKEALELAGKAFISMEAENSDLRERLRQREAELEQREADILRYVEAVKGWRKSMMNATNKPHGALLLALLECARPEWPMPTLPSPPKESKS